MAISNEPDALWPPKALRSLLQPAINNLNFGLRTLGFEDTKVRGESGVVSSALRVTVKAPLLTNMGG